MTFTCSQVLCLTEITHEIAFLLNVKKYKQGIKAKNKEHSDDHLNDLLKIIKIPHYYKAILLP